MTEGNRSGDRRRRAACLEEVAFLELARTTDMLSRGLVRILKVEDLSPTQYNVLRILRGAGKDGLCRNEVRDRMVAQVPDVTRLLDRLEDAGLIERERSTEDRRQVGTRITARGLQLLSELDAPVAEIHRRQLGHLSASQLRALAELLTLARQRP